MKILNTLTLLFAITLSQSVFADLPMISNMQVMAQPPGANVTAGYLTIKNISSEPLMVTGASSDAIARIEMHESVVMDDVASMTRHDELQIDSGETLEFKHGGFHLMLMDLSAPLIPGSSLNVTLHTNQGDIELVMPVVMPGMSGKSKMNH